MLGILVASLVACESAKSATSPDPETPSAPSTPPPVTSAAVTLNDDFDGRELPAPGNWWSQDISAAPVDAGSAAFIDFIGRTLVGAGRMREADKTFTFTQTGGGTGSGSGSGTGGGSGSGNRPDEILSVTRRELQLQSGDLHLSFGSASIRFSPWRSVLITAGVLFPMSQAGLRDRVTPVLGIDYAF